MRIRVGFLQADNQRGNGCSEGVGVTEVSRDELRRVYKVEGTGSCG
jgi:hypothetical protein